MGKKQPDTRQYGCDQTNTQTIIHTQVALSTLVIASHFGFLLKTKIGYQIQYAVMFGLCGDKK